MNRTILSHDVDKATAKVRFEHNGVITEQEIDLARVIPGSTYVMEQMGISFTEEYQLKTLDKFTDTIQSYIEQGIITNPPEEEVIVPVEETPTTSKKKSKAKE